MSALQAVLNVTHSYKPMSLTGNTMQMEYRGSSGPSKGKKEGKKTQLLN